MQTFQDTIEENMLVEAKQRLDQDILKTTKRGAWSESKVGARYQKSLAPAFAKTVAEEMAKYEPGKARTNGRAITLLTKAEIEPDVIAHLAIKAMLNFIPIRRGKHIRRTTLCLRIADVIHDEMRIRHFASTKERKALLKKLFKQFDKRTYPRDWRKRTIKNYFHAEQVEWTGWSDTEKVHVGYALMCWFRDSTGYIEAPAKSQYVEPSLTLLEHVEKMMKARELDYMLYKPMVVKPLPWSLDNLFRGGYISDRIKHYPLVKKTSRKDVEALLTRDWTKIIPAINALQETPWRVHKGVLDVLMWAMHDRKGGFAGLPPADPIPLPPLPVGYDTDEEIKKAHNLVCFQIHSKNREIISKRMAVLQTISTAQQFKNFDAIYFPHNLDSRGRAYPLPAFLNPQGTDSTKALLEFSRGLPIETEEQACWIAIAGANAYGNDKVSLQERADWVIDNEDMILSIARDPYGDLRWTEAGDPFLFLRFCYEWAGFSEQGFGFVSHMVCHVDATCSGLQHYSAMLRDEVGGRSVNLIPGLPRQDIYQDVANLVVEKIMDSTGEVRAIAVNLIGIGIDRKVTKRQVMVVPYAGTFSSCMEYTRAAVHEKIKDGAIVGWDTNDKEQDNAHVVLLAKMIWESISDVVVKGKQAMNWLTKSARAYVKIANGMEGSPRSKALTWVTPDGFLVRHYATDEKKRQVATFLDGRVDLVLYAPTDRLSAQDMATGVAPNFVHSMDANLLRAAVIKGVEAGITDFGMIHDSFGVHAARMAGFLSDCVKPAFIQMYDRDVLADFRDRMLATAPGLELEPMPAKGTLDLAGVQDSEFFFS